MKKLLLLIILIAMLGVGCATSKSGVIPTKPLTRNEILELASQKRAKLVVEENIEDLTYLLFNEPYNEFLVAGKTDKGVRVFIRSISATKQPVTINFLSSTKPILFINFNEPLMIPPGGRVKLIRKVTGQKITIPFRSTQNGMIYQVPWPSDDPSSLPDVILENSKGVAVHAPWR